MARIFLPFKLCSRPSATKAEARKKKKIHSEPALPNEATVVNAAEESLRATQADFDFGRMSLAAIGAYGQAVLNAFEEVEAALTNSDLLERREDFLGDSVENNFQAYRLAQKQYEVGQIELLNLLQLQSGWIGARVGLLNVQNLRLAERINLHLALGGSFEDSGAEGS